MKKLSKIVINSGLLMLLFGILVFPMVSVAFVKLGQNKSTVLSAQDTQTAPTAISTPAPTAQATEVNNTNEVVSEESSQSSGSTLTPEDQMPSFDDINGSKSGE